MKYFTPELYEQFNSLDVVEAEAADEAWDRAETAYRMRLASIRDRLPAPIVKLSELCLHDALVVSREEQALPFGDLHAFERPTSNARPALWTAVGIVSVTLHEEVVSLIYWLSDHFSITETPVDWRFSRLQEQWLYDEVDLLDDRGCSFVHRILFSTGVTLEIPFTSVIIHRFRVPVVPQLAKQSA